MDVPVISLFPVGWGATSVKLKEDSRTIRSSVKAGRQLYLQQALEQDAIKSFISSHLLGAWTLVPVPRSSILTNDANYPAFEICKTLLNSGIGDETVDLLQRVKSIRKSSMYTIADERPSVGEKMETLGFNDEEILDPQNILIVDDVITQGRTAMSCILKIKEKYPQASFQVFSAIRSLYSDTPYSKLLNPAVSKLTIFPSGKTRVEHPNEES